MNHAGRFVLAFSVISQGEPMEVAKGTHGEIKIMDKNAPLTGEEQYRQEYS
jgi:hypothetical protein